MKLKCTVLAYVKFTFYGTFSYWDTVYRSLWHRFDAVMEMHNASVREIDVKKMQPQPDTRPHYVSFFECFRFLSDDTLKYVMHNYPYIVIAFS